MHHISYGPIILSGLDIKTEKIVEKSIIEYTKEKGAVVLWVTHDEDVAERLLSI